MLGALLSEETMRKLLIKVWWGLGMPDDYECVLITVLDCQEGRCKAATPPVI